MITLLKIWNLFLDAVFPSVCAACGRKGDKIVCEECFAATEVNNSFFCPVCNRRIPSAPDVLKTENLCHPEAKFILAAAASYGNKPIRELIHALKYSRAKTALEPLAKITNQYIEKIFRNSELEIRNFIIVPLPLHPRKERERGFNQAALIAGIMNKGLGITVQENNLIRTKNTKSQTNLKDGEERRKNVDGVFAVMNPDIIAGRNVILIDDVFTSGATMREAVRVLKNAGAKKIIGLVIAKA